MKTIVILKPDCLKRGLMVPVLKALEPLAPVKMRMLRPSREDWERHYAVHKGKHFYDGLIEFMLTGPVVVMLFDGDIAEIREKVPKIREWCGYSGPANIIHASDSPDSALLECLLWEPYL